VPAYLVRLKENREIVGIFVAERSSLDIAIDECCDPGACEYVKLSMGGIYKDNGGAPAVPHAFNEEYDNPPPDWFSGATISEFWHGAFFEESTWKSVGREE